MSLCNVYDVGPRPRSRPHPRISLPTHIGMQPLNAVSDVLNFFFHSLCVRTTFSSLVEVSESSLHASECTLLLSALKYIKARHIVIFRWTFFRFFSLSRSLSLNLSPKNQWSKMKNDLDQLIQFSFFTCSDFQVTWSSKWKKSLNLELKRWLVTNKTCNG